MNRQIVHLLTAEKKTISFMMFGMFASPERYVIGPFVATLPNNGRREVQQKELISLLFNNSVRDGVLDEMTGIKPPRSSSASVGKIANPTPNPKVADCQRVLVLIVEGCVIRKIDCLPTQSTSSTRFRKWPISSITRDG